MSPAAAGDPPYLRTSALCKSFGETKALASIDFEVCAGEIRALVGGNGSGKSTFVKILAGVYCPDPGSSIVVGGNGFDEMTPELARGLGFRFVHQDAGVIDDLTVAENLVLGHPYPTSMLGLIRWRKLADKARILIERFDIGTDPLELVKNLRPATRTKVAVARALQDVDLKAPGLLVFDEPTTALPNDEASHLLAWIRGFAKQGQAVLFVSHRLDEVLALAETVTVFRDGHHVATVNRAELDADSIVGMMVGRQLTTARPAVRFSDGGNARLEVRGLKAGTLQKVDLSVAPGEILGVAGLLGSGRTSLLRAIAGDLQYENGLISVNGRPLRARSVSEAMDAGIAFVPENRLLDATLPDLTVGENLLAASSHVFTRWGLSRPRMERQEIGRLITEYGIRCSGPGQTFSTLSGGNQQKAIIARWLRREPAVLLLDEPSQGVDVVARNEIEELIRMRAAQGMSVLIVTSDFDELARIADRVIVLFKGAVHTQISQANLTEQYITQLTYGPGKALNANA